MSAKPSEPKSTDPVDTVTDKLANLGASASEADLAAAKKAEKKARQKAKKDAENKDSKETKPAKEENGSGEGGKAEKAKKSNKNKNKTKTPKTQTDPPTVPISVLFSGKDYPEGQIMDHPIGNDDAKAKQRFTSEEARALDRAQLDMYNEIR